jgi:hypothetical protein
MTFLCLAASFLGQRSPRRRASGGKQKLLAAPMVSFRFKSCFLAVAFEAIFGTADYARSPPAHQGSLSEGLTMHPCTWSPANHVLKGATTRAEILSSVRSRLEH